MISPGYPWANHIHKTDTCMCQALDAATQQAMLSYYSKQQEKEQVRFSLFVAVHDIVMMIFNLCEALICLL